MNALVLACPPKNGKSGTFDYRILKVSSIRDVRVLESPKNKSDITPQLLPVPLSFMEARESKAVKSAAQALARRGVGVTQDAQDLFDGLNKTLPCTWSGTSILVLGEISIDAPYTGDSIRALSGESSPNDPSLQRVRKVVCI